MKAEGIVRSRARWIRTGILGLLVALILAAPLASAQTVPAKPIVVKAGQPEFTVALESNRTTGFAWYLEALDGSLLEATGHAYKAPGGGSVGAPGQETWTFIAQPGAFAVPRVTTVVFRYMRAWEAEGGKEARITVVLDPGS